HNHRRSYPSAENTGLAITRRTRAQWVPIPVSSKGIGFAEGFRQNQPKPVAVATSVRQGRPGAPSLFSTFPVHPLPQLLGGDVAANRGARRDRGEGGRRQPATTFGGEPTCNSTEVRSATAC